MLFLCLVSVFHVLNVFISFAIAVLCWQLFVLLLFCLVAALSFLLSFMSVPVVISQVFTVWWMLMLFLVSVFMLCLSRTVMCVSWLSSRFDVYNMFYVLYQCSYLYCVCVLCHWCIVPRLDVCECVFLSWWQYARPSFLCMMRSLSSICGDVYSYKYFSMFSTNAVG